MPKIDDAHYEQGLAAYRSGTSLRQMIDLTEAVSETLGKAADEMPEGEERSSAYRRAGNAEQSLMMGFADGVLADLRAVLTSPTFSRLGQKA